MKSRKIGALQQVTNKEMNTAAGVSTDMLSRLKRELAVLRKDLHDTQERAYQLRCSIDCVSSVLKSATNLSNRFDREFRSEKSQLDEFR